MKKFTLATLILTLLLAFSYNGQSQEKDAWIETFDSEHSNGYKSTPIDINERVWTRKDAGNFSYANTTMGSYAFTINDDKSEAFIASPSLNTIGTVMSNFILENPLKVIKLSILNCSVIISLFLFMYNYTLIIL